VRSFFCVYIAMHLLAYYNIVQVVLHELCFQMSIYRNKRLQKDNFLSFIRLHTRLNTNPFPDIAVMNNLKLRSNAAALYDKLCMLCYLGEWLLEYRNALHN